MKPLLGLATAGAIFYVCICLAFYVWQTSLIYFPAREIKVTPRDYGLSYSEVWLRTEDGVRLHSWVVPARPDVWVLFCHGNGGNIANRMDDLRLLHQMEASVLLFDYRGYGRSEGVPAEAGLYADAEAAWTYLMQQGVSPGNVVIMGESLGGAVAVELARRHSAGGLVVRSSFTSVPDLGAQLYPWLPVRWLCRNRFPSGERIGRVACRKLIAHSAQDEIIPFSHGRKLFEAASEPKQWVQLEGHHNTSPLALGADYRRAMQVFLGLHAPAVL